MRARAADAADLRDAIEAASTVTMTISLSVSGLREPTRHTMTTPAPAEPIRWAVPLAATAPLVDAFIRDIPEMANREKAAALSGRAWWLWVALGWWLLVHASALWDSNRRGWHDKASDTFVVKAASAH